MPLRIGCDLVLRQLFERRIIRAERRGLGTVFSPPEYLDNPLETLAGIFAAKEIACKTLSPPPRYWLDLSVEHAPSEESLMKLVWDLSEVEALRVSIAHAGNDALVLVTVQTL